MGFYKTVHRIRSIENGWDEIWYVQAASLEAALAKAEAMLPLRYLMFGLYTFMTDIKVFDESNPKVSRVKTWPQDAVNPNNPNNAPPVTTAWTAINVRIEAGTQYHRTWAIKGVPDEWTRYSVVDNTWTPPKAFTNALQAWFLTATGPVTKLYLKVFSKEPGDNPKVLVTGVAPNAGAGTVTITAAGHALSLGDQVRIKNVAGPNLYQSKPGRLGVNGRWKVMNVTANTFDIGLPLSTLTGTPSWKENGTVQGCKYFYAPLANAIPMQLMRRKVGAYRGLPNGRVRGRRKNFS